MATIDDILTIINSGDFAKAVELLEDEQVTQYNAVSADILALLGRAYYGLGRFAESECVLTKAISLFDERDPASRYVRFVLGCMAADRGDFRTAADEFLRLMHDPILMSSELKGLLNEVRERYAIISVESNCAQEAEAILLELLRTCVDDRREQRLRVYLGVYYHKRENSVAAREQFVKALELGCDPTLNFEAHYHLALLDYQVGALRSAMEHLSICEHHLEDKGKVPETYIFEMLARTSYYLGDNQRVEQYARAAAERGLQVRVPDRKT